MRITLEIRSLSLLVIDEDTDEFWDKLLVLEGVCQYLVDQKVRGFGANS